MTGYKDIHLHLSGAASHRTLWELIKDSGYKIGISNYWDFTKSFSLSGAGSLDKYLTMVHRLDLVQSSPLAVKACTYDAFTSSYLAGAEYLEIRFNPTKRSQNGIIDLDSIIIAARAGMEMATSRFGIRGSMCLCLGWDCTTEANEAVLSKAIKYLGAGVRAIDVAGPYQLATEDKRLEIARLLKDAKTMGLEVTCHAGEIDHDGLLDELLWTLRVQPHRIGHGIKMVKFPGMLDEAEKLGIHFEVCMSSNVASGSVSGYKDFAAIFKAFEEANVGYTLCTDATFSLSTDIAREHLIYKGVRSAVQA